MPAAIHVAILGFGAFERNALASHFKIAHGRTPSYEIVLDIDDACFVIADADQSGVIELLRELGRIGDAVFVGASAPAEAAAWMMRPIDPAHVMRELDRLLQQLEQPTSRPIPLGLPSGAGALRVLKGGAGVPAAQAMAPARRSGDQPSGEGDGRQVEARARRRHRPLPPPVMPVRRALLIDDSEIALHFLRRQLEPYGLAIDYAYDSTEALERLATQPYGIIFLDVDLGEGSELDGLALCHRIKAHQADLAGRQPMLVLVSAFHDPVHQVRGTFAGADAYLAKPLDRAVLDRMLKGIGLLRIDAAPVPPS